MILNLNLPENEPVRKKDLLGNEPVERETNLPDNDSLVKDFPDEDYSEQLPVHSDMPECDETNVSGNEGEEDIKEIEEQANMTPSGNLRGIISHLCGLTILNWETT